MEHSFLGPCKASYACSDNASAWEQSIYATHVCIGLELWIHIHNYSGHKINIIIKIRQCTYVVDWSISATYRAHYHTCRPRTYPAFIYTHTYITYIASSAFIPCQAGLRIFFPRTGDRAFISGTMHGKQRVFRQCKWMRTIYILETLLHWFETLDTYT